MKEGLGRDDELREGLMHLRIGLDERSEDLGMLPEVTQEGVTALVTHDLHRLDWHATKQVEQSSANSYTMPLKWFLAGLPSS